MEILAKKGVSDKDGLLAPRVTKAELDAKATTTYNNSQNSAMVYVTDATSGATTTSAAQTTKITQPGFYYFKDTEWIPLGGTPSAPALNPWLVQGATTVATQNTENIYHTNKVAIGNDFSSSARTEELFVNGNSMFQTKNDGLVGNNNTQSYQYMTRDKVYLTNLNRNATNVVQTRAQIDLFTEADPIYSTDYNVAKIDISTGSKVTGSTRFSQYSVSSNDSKIQNGLGAHTFTTWLPNKTNSIVAIDEKGLKLGFLNNIDATSITLDGIGSTIGIGANDFTATTYYLPKASPTSGQVLMFDQLIPAASGVQAYSTTKWGTLADLTVPNIYTTNGTISQQRTINVTDSNTVTFTRTGTVSASDVPVISTNGSVQAIALRLDSDARLKENIKPINGDLALQLNPVSYTWNTQGKAKGGNNQKQYGFIAQEVEKVLPDAVFTDEKGYKSVNYIEVIPVLTQKVKEQQQLIDELLKRVEVLETKSK